jgi:hypothetical protein
MTSPVKWLRGVLAFISVFHIVAGLGLMFSVQFQKFAVALYGAALTWDAKDIYFIRIVGSFAFVLGYLAAMAARDPLKHQIVVVGFIEFFILRNINRHLYSGELYSGFGVSPLVNNLTTVFFGVQAILLGGLLWQVNRDKSRRPA